MFGHPWHETSVIFESQYDKFQLRKCLKISPAISFKPQCVNPWTRSIPWLGMSVNMILILNVYNAFILVFIWSELQKPVVFHCQEITWTANILYILWEIISMSRVMDLLPGYLYYRLIATQHKGEYRKISNISRTKSPNLNVSRLVLQLSLLNPLNTGVKSRMKM